MTRVELEKLREDSLLPEIDDRLRWHTDHVHDRIEVLACSVDKIERQLEAMTPDKPSL